MIIVCTLVTAEATLEHLGVHVTDVSLPAILPSPELVPHAERAVPLEAIRLPATLDGHAGINQGGINRYHTDVLNGYQAIQTWLSLRPTGGYTWRAYRKEMERCLAWAILECSRAFNGLLADDCLAHRTFLA